MARPVLERYPYAIWDMNVEGAQWGALSANYVEQTQAFTHRISEQLPNLIAAVYVRQTTRAAARARCVCAVNDIDIVLLPCNHATICTDCLPHLTPRICPCCRAPTQSTRRCCTQLKHPPQCAAKGAEDGTHLGFGGV